jgi:hypothetical protein
MGELPEGRFVIGEGWRVVALAGMLLGIALALFVGSASEARAADVSCGDTLTRDTTLDADLSCPGGSALVIGARRITVDLNGYSVESVCDEEDCSASIGIDNAGGYDRVKIIDGEVAGVQAGIRLEGADRNELRRLDVHGGGYERRDTSSVALADSDRNLIADSTLGGGDPALLFVRSDRNKVVDSSIAGGVAIHSGSGVAIQDGSDWNILRRDSIGGVSGAGISASDRNVIASSQVRGYDDAIEIYKANRTRVKNNDLDGGQGFALAAGSVNRSDIVGNVGKYPIAIGGDRNLVKGNEVMGGWFSGVALTVAGGDRNEVRGNLARYGFMDAEILVTSAATRTLVAGNTAIGSHNDPRFTDDDGIRVNAPGTTIRGNTAIDNSDLGIDAVKNVIDGGGNHASGNGNPLQCVNVVCTP